MAEIAAAAARLARGDKPLDVEIEPEAREVPPPDGGMARLFLSAGRRNGVRPADIVGAIANEAGVPGKSIGSIDIYDNFTFVEVPEEYRDQVLERMSKATIRGRPVEARIARPEGPGGPRRPDRPGGESRGDRGGPSRRPAGAPRRGEGWRR